jgi:hypothetical protein
LDVLSLRVSGNSPAVGVLFGLWVFFDHFQPIRDTDPNRSAKIPLLKWCVLVLFLIKIGFRPGWDSIQLRTQHF